MIPIAFTWDGEAMVPLKRFQPACDKQFTVHEVYPLVVQEQRSMATHNHYFASLHEAWLNLPEEIAGEFLNEEQLRKHALIATGYCDKQSFVCANSAEARRMAAFIQPIDPCSVVTVIDKVVTRYTAHSQSMRSMGKATFQKSKSDVLEYVSSMVGVKPDDLKHNARQVA